MSDSGWLLVRGCQISSSLFSPSLSFQPRALAGNSTCSPAYSKPVLHCDMWWEKQHPADNEDYWFFNNVCMCVYIEKNKSVGDMKREKKTKRNREERKHLLLINICYEDGPCTEKIFSPSDCFCFFFPNWAWRKQEERNLLFFQISYQDASLFLGHHINLADCSAHCDLRKLF